MKKIIGLVFLMTFIATTCYADLVVIYYKNTKDIYTISEKDDTVVPDNCEKVILPGKTWKNTEFPVHPGDCKLVDGKFVENTAKIQKREEKEAERLQRKADKELKRTSAKEKLKALGLTDEEIKALFE